MDKIFTEHDWDKEDVSELLNFTFAKHKQGKKKTKERNDQQSNNKHEEPGRFVRAPPADNNEPATITNGKPKPSKRKQNELVGNLRLETELPEPISKKLKNGSAAKESLNHKAKSKSKPSLTEKADFRAKLVDSLKGSRFRFINEQLYKTTGTEAKRLFQEDTSAFQAYHEGYRHQIVQWSVNPLDRIVKSFSKLPADFVVADFGCGEARLAQSIEQKVYSLDLVAANNSVISCDMANTPLETNSINVAVFCLSLMGTNLRDFLLEANRVMKIGGLLKIAEVSSRFDNVKEFIDCVHKCGYLLDNKDMKHKLFYFFNFKKIEDKHRELNPNCAFLLHPDRTDNVRCFDAEELKREECRLATFVNWPVPHISPNSLAKAGFYYTYNADQVKCAWCAGVIGQWEVGDDPFAEHQKFFPACAKVIADSISSNPVLDPSVGIQPVKTPFAAQFSSLDSRIRSFENWTAGHIQDPERLAQAGFYYLGRADEVNCFYCDGGLRFWLADDDPWFEHARCFPKCQFVQLVKGQLFIENVQSQIKNASTSQQQQQMQPGGQIVVTMNLEEALGTEPVQLALSMGLNAGRIRAVTKRQLETTGQPYTDSQALIEAVLDGQIQDEELEPTTSSRMDRRIESEVSRLLWTAISSTAGPNLSSFSSTFSTPSPSSEPVATSGVAAAEGRVVADSNPSSSLPTSSSVNDSSSDVDHLNVPESLAQMAADAHRPLGIRADDKTLRLEEENKRLKDARECKICMADEVGVVFCPCGHLVSCVQCAPAVTNCPVCRAVIKGRVRTFLS